VPIPFRGGGMCGMVRRRHCMRGASRAVSG
jgi:hypothetical protein